VLEKLINTAAPHLCLVCGLEGEVVCSGCRNDVVFAPPSRCFMCNAITNNYKTCTTCRRKTAINNVWIAGEHDGHLKQLIAEYKFSRKRASAKLLAGFVAEALPQFERKPLVTFVPTSTSHTRQRGYDQAELLARELGKQTGLRALRLLVRTSQAHQVGANRTTRLHQLEGAFRPIRKAYIKNASILLVDDVLTTGATLRTASKALKAAGAGKIYGAVIAKHI